MSKIIKSIEEAKKRGASDAEILEEIINSNPNKLDIFKLARDRGASDAEIIEKIIEDNEKRAEREELKKKKELERIKIEKQSELIEEKESIENQKEEAIDETKLSGKFVVFKKRVKDFVATFKNSKFAGDIFFSNPYLVVGVDISDYSIEVLLLDKKRHITSYNRSVIAEGVIENGEIVDQRQLSETLKETLKNAKPQPLNVPEHTRKKSSFLLEPRDYRAVISLPDSKTYIQVFSFEKRTDLYNQIKEKMKTTIPLDFDEIYWDFIELPSKEGVKILWVGALRDVVDGYIHFFKSTNIDPIVFEIEGISIGRSLLTATKKTSSLSDKMVIDMGAKVSSMNIYNKEGLLSVSVSLPYAGHYFTKKIADELQIPKLDAEDLKQKEGFKKESKIYQVLEKEGEKIVDEIKKISRYYQREFGGQIKEIILSGGTSLLPEIVNFFNQRLDDVDVSLGNPLQEIVSGTGKLNKNSVLYANVVGLSLRSLQKESLKEGINLLPEEIKNQAVKMQTENNKLSAIAALFFFFSGIILLSAVVYFFVLSSPQDNPLTNIFRGGQDSSEQVEELAPEKEGVEEIIEEQLPSRPELPADSYRLMVYIKDDLGSNPYIFASPNEEDMIIDEILPGSRYRFLEKRADWVRVSSAMGDGWVQLDNLENIRPDDSETVFNYSGEIKETAGSSGYRVTNFPINNSSGVFMVYPNEVYRVLEKSSNWVMIETGQVSGWIPIDFINLIEV